MGKFANLNKGKRLFDIDVKDSVFVKLSDLYEKNANGMYCIKGFFVNRKGCYNPHYVLIVEHPDEHLRVQNPYILVDAPEHMSEIFDQISADQSMIESIKKGECYFKVYQYDSKTRKGCHGIELLDAEDIDDLSDMLFDRGKR